MVDYKMGRYRGKTCTEEIQSVSSSLKFISKLKPKEKVFVSSQSIYPDTYWNSMFRNFQGEGRDKTYQFIKDKINDGMDILKNYPLSTSESDVKICRNLVIDLVNLNPAFDSLKVTYSDDQKYVSNIESMAQDLDINIREICCRFSFNYEQILEEAHQIFELSKIAEEEDSDQNQTGSTGDGSVGAGDGSGEVVSSVAGTGSGSGELSDEPKSPKSPRQRSGITLTESGHTNVGSIGGLKTALKKKDLDNEDHSGDKSTKPMDLMSKICKKQEEKKKNYHQYDSFYRSSPEDIHQYHPDWNNGLNTS